MFTFITDRNDANVQRPVLKLSVPRSLWKCVARQIHAWLTKPIDFPGRDW